MIKMQELELKDIDTKFPYWSLENYFDNVLPKIDSCLSDDEKFLISNHVNERDKEQQILYCATISNLTIEVDRFHTAETTIKMVLTSYRLHLEVIFKKVSGFSLKDGDEEGSVYDDILCVFISLNSEERRFYMLSVFQPVVDSKLNFIEYDSLEIIKKEYVKEIEEL